MNKVISSNYAIDYAIYIHDNLNKNVLKIYFYEKDLINDKIIR